MASLTKMHTPKSILIPLTVFIRYFPSIGEDRRAIKKAMVMRGLLNGFWKHPKMTIECLYVPLLMSASMRADELSTAAVTRGIENPKPRTSLKDVRFRLWDLVCFIIGTVVVILCVGGVWI
jgi:energy-coupling factor transport system permease protein